MQESGQVTISELCKTYDLPGDFLTQVLSSPKSVKNVKESVGNWIRWFYIRYSGYLSQPWFSWVPSMFLERLVENNYNYPTPQAPRHLRVVNECILGLSWCHRRACSTSAWICLVLIIFTVETNQDICCFL